MGTSRITQLLQITLSKFYDSESIYILAEMA